MDSVKTGEEGRLVGLSKGRVVGLRGKEVEGKKGIFLIAVRECGSVRAAAKECGVHYDTIYAWMKGDEKFQGEVELAMKVRREEIGGTLIGKLNEIVLSAIESRDPRLIQATSSHVRVVAEAVGLIGQKAGGGVTINNQVVAVPGLADLMKEADVWERRKAKVVDA
jgi:molybdenum-dependent DNA-binding transcriptional regulator ModE